MEGFVLSGGDSRRMGVDKARVAFPGRWPMAVHVARVSMAGGCQRVRLVRRGVEQGPWPLAVLREPPHEGAHPLWGVAAALEAATGPLALVVSCDLPWLTPEAVAKLLARGPTVAHGERLQPLVAVWPTDWAERVRRQAASGGSARALASELPSTQLPPAVLRDLDDWREVAHTWPTEAVRRRLTFLDEAAMDRVLAGELGRLWARGALDPSVPVA